MKHGKETILCLRLLVVLMVVFVYCSNEKNGEKKSETAPSVTLELYHLKTRLFGDSTIVTIGGTVRLPHGWHTYWLNPGDVGLAPRFEAASPDVHLDPPRLSLPVRIQEKNDITFGYHDSMLFIIDARTNGNELTTITLSGNILICKDICLPVKCTSSVSIEARPEKKRQFPKTGFGTFDSAVTATFQETDTTMLLTVYKSGWKLAAPRIETLFPMTQGIAELAVAPRFTITNDTLVAELRRPQLGASVPDTVEGLLLLKSPSRQGILFRAISDTAKRITLIP